MKTYRCLLPKMLRKESHITRSRQTVFGGLSSLPDAPSHEISDMMGLSPTAYPAMGTSEGKLRYETDTWGQAHGIFHHRRMMMARGERLCAVTLTGEVEEICNVSDTDKSFAAFGPYLFVMPDGICYDADKGEVRSLSLDTGWLEDGTLGSRHITWGTLDWQSVGFRKGDGIRVTVRNYYLGSEAVFYRKITGMTPGTLFLNEGFEQQGMYELSISLAFPQMTRMLTCGNKLMGAVGHTIYICEADNPLNWYAKTGEDTDPLQLQVGDKGDITACAVLDDTPVFFKEDCICRLLGRTAGDYVLSELALPGIPAHNAASLCALGGRLYYLAAGGVYAYDGDEATPVGEALPSGLYQGVGGSDGVFYHLSALKPDGTPVECVFHPKWGTWHITGNTRAVSLAVWEELLFSQSADGELWRQKRAGEVLPTEDGKLSEMDRDTPLFAVFGEEFGGTPDGLRLHAIHLRAEGDENAYLTVSVAYAGSHVWETVGEVKGRVSGLCHIPVYPRRAESYRIKLEMTGKWRISEMTCDYEKGKQ